LANATIAVAPQTISSTAAHLHAALASWYAMNAQLRMNLSA
jgi:hypothetical protein